MSALRRRGLDKDSGHRMCGCSADVPSAKRVHKLHIFHLYRRKGSPTIILAPILNYKDPHTISRTRRTAHGARSSQGARGGHVTEGRATHALLRSSVCRTSGSLVAAVALVRSALAGFSERAVCLHNAAEKVARRRSASRAELHHLRAVPDDEGQGRR